MDKIGYTTKVQNQNEIEIIDEKDDSARTTPLA